MCCAASSFEFVEMIDDNQNVLKRIVTVTKVGVSCTIQNQNIRVQLGRAQNKLKAQKLRLQKSRVKTMLTAIFDAKGVIHHEFLLEKHTVNSKFYKEVIKRLSARVHHIRPEFQKVGPGIFCMTMHWHILYALFQSFWRNKGSPCYPIHPIPLIYRQLTFFIS
jgi:hypothetical protein